MQKAETNILTQLLYIADFDIMVQRIYCKNVEKIKIMVVWTIGHVIRRNGEKVALFQTHLITFNGGFSKF